jgi:hypothetical protein
VGRFPGGGGGGAGTITEITTDTPDILVITNPEGPTVDIDAFPPEGINEITTSTPGSLVITDPEGPTTNLAISVPVGVTDLTTTEPGVVIISNPTGPTTNIDVVTSSAGGVLYSASAPGATPMSGVSLLAYNCIQLTGIAATITDMSPSTMPTDPTYQVRFVLMDNGTPQAITSWGADYEVSSELPTTTLGGGGSPIPLMVTFWYNSVTQKLVCTGVSAVTNVVIADTGPATGSIAIGTTLTPVFATPPTLGVGIWKLDFDTYVTASTGITQGDTCAFEVSGGTATYTVIPTAPQGNPPGAKTRAGSSTVGAIGNMVHMTTYIKVTVAGTVNVAGIGSSAFFTCTGRDISFPSTTLQVTVLSCFQIG